MSDPILQIEDLHVKYHTRNDAVEAVSDASFSIEQNEYFGLVGESGCGKSTLAKSIIGRLDENGEVTEGRIVYQGHEIQDYSERELNQKIRWKEIAVIPQSAMNGFDPLSRISEQAVEVANTHTDWPASKTKEKLRELFDVVGLPESRINDYPHQFSGGMRQRAVIALALLLEPDLIIADEPTTALDVIMQDQFLKFVDEIRDQRDFGLLFITHDIAVIFEICNSLAVMHGGQIAESASTETIFDHPRHPYTILLQQAFPDVRYPDRELEEISGYPPTLQGEIDFCTFADRCPWAEPKCREGAPPLEPMAEDEDHLTSCIRSHEMESLASDYLNAQDEGEAGRGKTPPTTSRARPSASDDPPNLELRGLKKHFDPSVNVLDTIRSRILGHDEQQVRAVDGVDIRLQANQVQGIIGESGCGKSTLLKTIIGKYEPTKGEIRFQGKPLSDFTKSDWKDFRRRVQMILQDPFNSINPKFTVREALLEPLMVHDLDQSEERLLEVLERVQLEPAEAYIDRKESALSGGEKQRVSIARALIPDPDVILADEPVSMLDVSVQASILQLLGDLAEDYDVSMLYVSHDLSTVSYVCEQINVMYLGRVIESAPTNDLLNDPKHPYTQSLLQAIPIPDPHHDRQWTQLQGLPGDAKNLPTGCRFKDRCPERMEICDTRPLSQDVEEHSHHNVACHLHYDHSSVQGTPREQVRGDGGAINE